MKALLCHVSIYRITLGQFRIPKSETTKFNLKPLQREPREDENEVAEVSRICGNPCDGIPCECFGPTRVTTSSTVRVDTLDNKTSVSLSLGSEVDVDGEIRVQTVLGYSSSSESSSSNSSTNYYAEKGESEVDADEGSLESGEGEGSGPSSSTPNYQNQTEIRKPDSSSVGTQTEECVGIWGMGISKRSPQSSQPNSSKSSGASSTDNSTSLNLIDVQLRVEKLDLRVRVGGGKKEQGASGSGTTKLRLPLPHISFRDLAPPIDPLPLTVKGRRCSSSSQRNAKGPSKSQRSQKTPLPKI